MSAAPPLSANAGRAAPQRMLGAPQVLWACGAAAPASCDTKAGVCAREHVDANHILFTFTCVRTNARCSQPPSTMVRRKYSIFH